MTASKKILITGGAGFIGANLTRRLVHDGYTNVHVTIEKDTDLWRLTDIAAYITIHTLDMADTVGIKNLVYTLKPSYIFHLAAYGGSPYHNNEHKIYAVNFYGTMNLVNACKDIGIDCFINTGSSSEYGMKQTPMSEDNVLEPVSDYAVAKAAATQFCLKQALFNKLPIYTIRPFSVYGDYEMPERLIPTVIKNTLTHQPIHLSSPHCVRDFIYIRDMIDLYLAVAWQKPQASYVFNGGTGIQSSIRDVIDTVQRFWGKPLTVMWGQHAQRPWEPEHWQADIQRAQTVLGWQPRYSFALGLHVTMRWMSNDLGIHLDLPNKHDSLST